ncbi:hypothetical protein [Puniceibacterium confluentis]|uniref:hypothetical protein n=1 Tax=Puniceibacterium confluentis TaxID=1958944 RepID=UPI0011B73F18|nr:hypothetical protein [Puniceibacterium confluentis]
MKTIVISLALALTSSAAVADLQGFTTGLSDGAAEARVWTVAGGPGAGFQGDYYTTADNCTYRRTQAPGYPAGWILVLNPFHVGKPSAHRGCRGML